MMYVITTLEEFRNDLEARRKSAIEKERRNKDAWRTEKRNKTQHAQNVEFHRGQADAYADALNMLDAFERARGSDFASHAEKKLVS